MANNLIKFRNLQTSPSIPREQRESIQVLTLSMDDYIASPANVTMRYIDFVLGSDNAYVSKRLRKKAAMGQEEGMQRLKKGTRGNHVTQGKHANRDELKQRLRDDPVLGPILSGVEVLTNDALARSDV